jgi:hypothetical protein
MLVVVALTVLLMSIVAEVFVLASETMTQLRAISDMNQKVRTIETVLRLDLSNRTIREVQPPVQRMAGLDSAFGTADDYVLPLGVDPSQNLGYFMYSENSPADEQGEDTDDVLAWTMRLPQSFGARVAGIATAYYGRAVVSSAPDVAFGPTDGLAGSLEAEVVFFLRRGTLYRRVLLVGIAQPIAEDADSDGILDPGEDLNGNGVLDFNPTRSWYEQYDASARPPFAGSMVPLVNTLGDLSYRSTRYLHQLPAGYPTAGLAADNQTDANFPFLPVEFLDSNGSQFHDCQVATEQLDHNHNYLSAIPPQSFLPLPEEWIGRPTLLETSATSWAFPNTVASPPADPRPFGSAATRGAEDALLTNVLSFDVKAWDPDAKPDPSAALTIANMTGAFVDIGKLADSALPAWSAPGPPPSSGSPLGPPGSTLAGSYPRPGTWPPERPVLAPDSGPPPGYKRGFAAPWLGCPALVVPDLPGGMAPAPAALARTYDTWCTAYTRPADPTVTPVGPPYIVPLRGIQIKIRFVHPDTRVTREITIVQELQ